MTGIRIGAFNSVFYETFCTDKPNLSLHALD